MSFLCRKDGHMILVDPASRELLSNAPKLNISIGAVEHVVLSMGTRPLRRIPLPLLPPPGASPVTGEGFFSPSTLSERRIRFHRKRFRRSLLSEMGISSCALYGRERNSSRSIRPFLRSPGPLRGKSTQVCPEKGRRLRARFLRDEFLLAVETGEDLPCSWGAPTPAWRNSLDAVKESSEAHSGCPRGNPPRGGQGRRS